MDDFSFPARPIDNAGVEKIPLMPTKYVHQVKRTSIGSWQWKGKLSAVKEYEVQISE